jgi:hypothetical protein
LAKTLLEGDLMGYTQKLLKELRSVGPSLQREFHKILKA